MNRGRIVMMVVSTMLGILTIAAMAATQGPENIVIYGGQTGKVAFPHAQHQARIGDCNVCHAVFPQKAEAIKKMKEQGTLKPKKVMNLQCIKCHREAKKAGQPHGPLTCTSCHAK